MSESLGETLRPARESVLVVSIDAVAPRAISPETTPALCALARSGAACFTGTTVDPSITLPAHTSMLHGVRPSVHGVLDNSEVGGPMPPSFLQTARRAAFPDSPQRHLQGCYIDMDAIHSSARLQVQ